MRVYIVAPLKGDPRLHYDVAVTRAADDLRIAGHAPLNPARGNSRAECETVADFMRESLLDLAVADAVAMLPGWQDHPLSALEFHVAQALELPRLPFAEWIREAV